METASLKAINWTFTKGNYTHHFHSQPQIGETAVPQKSGQRHSLKMMHRYHFSSQLKRMATIVSAEVDRKTEYYVLIKGAPEKLLQFYDKSTV